MAWPRRNAPILLLCAALGASAALLLALMEPLTFFQDTWNFLLNRTGFSADVFLQPHNEHIVIAPVAIEKLLIELFGMEVAWPEQVVLVASLLITAVLVFVYVRRRMGEWPALFAATLLLFLGPAWWVLLWPFEISLVGAVAAGVAMLLALDRDDERGDVLACVFLGVSFLFGNLGVAFTLAALVDVWLRRHERGLRRLYVPVVPGLLFALWYLFYGSDTETSVTLRNIVSSPAFVLDGFASSLSSLLGLATLTGDGEGTLEWGRPLLVGAVVLLVVGLMRRPGLSPRLWPVLTAALAFWMLTAFNYVPGREPYTSRYMHMGAVFVLLIAADLLSGVRFRRQALIAAGVAVLAAVSANLAVLKDGSTFLKHETYLTKAGTGAIEIARETVDPNFFLTPEVAGTGSLIDVKAETYFPAADEHGTPAWSPSEIAAAPEDVRRQADLILAHALPVTTDTQPGVPSQLGGVAEQVVRDGRCRTVTMEGGGLNLRPGNTVVVLPPDGPATLRLRRFASAEERYPLNTEGVSGGTTTVLDVPPDLAPRFPWRLRVEPTQTATVCR